MATPLYWYSTSATMKRFVDRLSDLVAFRKPLGRALAGRHLFVAATSTDPELPAGFEQTFRSTTEYLDMAWGGCLHVCFERDLQLPVEAAVAARRLAKTSVLEPAGLIMQYLCRCE
ncbi:MAG: NAD(P)H-dependent oxidoreductase [Woeseiaceae bacterium]|nr:NAD(P)H-dependent oxidoreductase [Woeseiaceae bacterium]